MATSRQGNWLGQQRIDLPDLRSIESATSRDFDILAGTIMGGKYPLIVKGFTIPVTNKLTNLADTLLLNVADSILVHYNASESGTIFATPATATTELLSSTNSKVVGSFTPSATNYIGLDYLRSADTTTSDLTKFLDAGTLTEIEQTVPKARTLDYRIIITTQAFTTATNIAPLAIVVTDANNAVVSIKDTRNLFFRLGSGGDTANESYCYPWATDRTENGMTYVAGNLYDPFAGGDKSIGSMKDWMNAAMTGIWECRGGEFWYSAQNRDQVKMVYGPRTIVANEDNFYYNAGVLEWMNISLMFENGNGVYRNDVSDGSATMVDGQCLYVDLDRSQDIIATAGAIPPYTDGIAANVTDIDLLGTSVIPGRRYIIAWMIDGKVHCRDKAYPIDRPWHQAGEVGLGVVRINKTPVTNVLYANDSTDSSPVVLAIDDEGQVVNTAFAGNSTAFTGTGFGTGNGIKGIGSVAGSVGVWGEGTLASFGVYGVGATVAAGQGGSGVQGAGGATGIGNGGVGVWGTGGNSDTAPGIGVYGKGGSITALGNDTSATGATFRGGTAPHGTVISGNHGGRGAEITGADGGNGIGAGILGGTGGAALEVEGGEGGEAGDAATANGNGGRGIYAQGGASGTVGNTGAGGDGGYFKGGVGKLTDGIGIYGESGKGIGVSGLSSSSTGVKGESTTGAGVSGVSTDSYGVLGSSTNGEGGHFTGDTMGVSGQTAGVNGIGVNGFSVDKIGVKGASTNDAGGEFGGNKAIRITSGEIVYVPAKVRYATIAATDFTNDATYPGVYTPLTGYWKNEGDGSTWSLVFSAHLPVGSIIRHAHLLVESSDTAVVAVHVHLNHALNSLAADDVILTGAGGSGDISVGIGAAKAWVDLGTVFTFSILDGSWIYGSITVAGLTDTSKELKIHALRLTYDQTQNGHNI